VHAIVGADSYLAEQALETLLQAAVGSDRDDAVQVFRGDETAWPRLLEAARTGSLFATRRAVVVRNADAIKGEGDEVEAYLDDPAPGASLILMAAKFDKRKKPWKAVLDRAKAVAVDPLKGSALRSRVRDEVRRRRLPLAEGALEELIETVGQDLRRLMGELDKLEAFATGRSQPLSVDDVSAVLGRALGQPIYLMSDALGERRPATVLAQLEKLLDDGEPALKLLGALHRAIRQVRAARAMNEARMPPRAIAAKLLPPPVAFKVDALLAASRKWTDEDLKAALVALDRADRGIKNGGDAWASLSVAVVEACGGTDPGIRPGARPSR
jgi:DNA polymerase-3 subunit delta